MYRNIKTILNKKVCVQQGWGIVCKVTQTYENIKYSFQHKDGGAMTNTLMEHNTLQNLTRVKVYTHVGV